ncbi:anti-sigma factor [Microbacterium pygmaeum]|uniref:Regulator of SigK n=1 Tax=Microbacterium pygmaeum TaxID=370764 RepID=A0A1G7Y6U1_9MICO|nr:anti-sigma factor [Microbacterium pygmaeum]SDG92119.1 Anti-sigma-K factor RskA [Microbacterium pygmaeum]
MNEQEFAELAAGYVLNALSPDETAAFERARSAHPEWEAIVESDAATATRLAELTAPETPSAGIRAALLAQIAVTPQNQPTDIVPTADDAPPAAQTRAEARAQAELRAAAQSSSRSEPVAASARRPGGMRTWFALAASLVLLVGVGWGAVFVSEQLSTPASVVALQEIQDAPDVQSATAELADGGEATAYWSASLGKSVLVSDGLPSLADDQSFQAWFVRDGEAISAGTFAADGGTATALLSGDVQPGDVIAVTVEAVGGSETGQPTTDPILAIPTA